MANTWFKFKQFTINQERCAMKVGSDSVLLGAWTETKGIKKIVDLGSGTGILGLMLAQRCKARITAIESDIDAAAQAAENFNNSPWPELFDSVCANVHDLRKEYAGVFDLAIFNPPYFDGHVEAASEARTSARHLNLKANSREDWLKTAFEFTHDNGAASMIIPFENSEKWLKAMENTKWYVEKQCYVKGHEKAAMKRIMFFLKKAPGDCETNSLIIEKETRGQFTDSYTLLTKDFYLNL
jgi:tRNA1Val (adenine37-N6)-methyltransferase